MRQITEVLRLAAQGLSCRQIAQSVGISASTAQGYLKRAREAGLSWPLPDDVDAASRCRANAVRMPCHWCGGQPSPSSARC
jgi:FixJ family two-component response regulator